MVLLYRDTYQGHEVSSLHDGGEFLASVWAWCDLLSQQVPGWQVGEAVLLHDLLALRTLTATRAACYGQKTFTILPSANEVWSKVIFLHLCIILLTSGFCIPRGSAFREGGGLHPREVCIQGGCAEPPPSIGYYGIRSTSGRYAFHWNAFLFSFKFWWTHCPFMGQLIFLFRLLVTSRLGFKARVGSLIRTWCVRDIRVTFRKRFSSSPLGTHWLFWLASVMPHWVPKT